MFGYNINYSQIQIILLMIIYFQPVRIPKMLEMATVMITIMYPSVAMMVEIAVDHVQTNNSAPLVLVLMEDQAMPLPIYGLEMATVTMDLTMPNVNLMMKIVVETL